MLTIFRRATVRRSLWAVYTLLAIFGLMNRLRERQADEPHRLPLRAATPPVTATSGFIAVPLRQPWTLLRTAAAAGDADAVRRLLEKGAEPDGIAPFAPLPYTPLTIACQNNHLAAARVLLDYGANPNAGPRTPLMAVAASNADPRLIDLLIGHGARVNARCQEAAYEGWTALDFAAATPQTQRAALVNRLREYGAKPTTVLPH